MAFSLLFSWVGPIFVGGGVLEKLQKDGPTTHLFLEYKQPLLKFVFKYLMIILTDSSTSYFKSGTHLVL